MQCGQSRTGLGSFSKIRRAVALGQSLDAEPKPDLRSVQQAVAVAGGRRVVEGVILLLRRRLLLLLLLVLGLLLWLW